MDTQEKIVRIYVLIRKIREEASFIQGEIEKMNSSHELPQQMIEGMISTQSLLITMQGKDIVISKYQDNLKSIGNLIQVFVTALESNAEDIKEKNHLLMLFYSCGGDILNYIQQLQALLTQLANEI